MPIQLYTDATHKFPSGSAWGHPVPKTITGDGVITMSVPALLFMNRNTLAGTYEADFTVTLNYSTGPLGCGTLAPGALTGASSTSNALPKPAAASGSPRREPAWRLLATAAGMKSTRQRQPQSESGANDTQSGGKNNPQYKLVDN